MSHCSLSSSKEKKEDGELLFSSWEDNDTFICIKFHFSVSIYLPEKIFHWIESQLAQHFHYRKKKPLLYYFLDKIKHDNDSSCAIR